MKKNEPQNPESTDNENTNRELTIETAETAESFRDQETADEVTDLTSSELPGSEPVILPEEILKSKAETERLINEIKEPEEKSESEYDSLSREELVIRLEKAVSIDDINIIKAEVALIKVTFLKKEKEEKELLLAEFLEKGGKKEDFTFSADSMTDRFNIAFGVYKEKKAIFNEDIEKQKLENLALKLKILDDLKHLVESEDELKKTYDAFKILQAEWKEIGLVPKSEINNLWQNYNFLVEKFFDKVKINKELKDLDLKKNLEAKIELCEKTEELLLETSISKSFNQLQKYHEMWREMGPVPQDKKDEIWERFRNASDKINERRRQHYEKMRADQETNLAAKTSLCEKAEQIAELEISTVKDWHEQSSVLNEMLQAWKTIGAASKKENDEVWTRFRNAIDNFYDNKKEHFGKFKDEQTNNYNQKLNLCLQVEALKDSKDWKRTTDEIIRLQQEWKKIGQVPKKYSDKIWHRFRAACNHFFDAKAAYYDNISSEEEENMKLKKELIQQVKEYEFGTNNTENLQIIKNFQRKWMEIGYVPVKSKNEIQTEFRDAINEKFDKLKIGAVEKNTMGFKAKFENIAQSPGGDQAIYKEKTFITNKINTIKNDIKLWENNIGFFANSKKANVLKEEFLNKIEKAKEEVSVLEEKLKFLKEVK